MATKEPTTWTQPAYWRRWHRKCERGYLICTFHLTDEQYNKRLSGRSAMRAWHKWRSLARWRNRRFWQLFLGEDAA